MMAAFVERFFERFFFLVSLSALLILLGIFFFLSFTGFQFFLDVSFLDFFLGTDWNPTSYSEASWGILSLFVGTLIVTLGSLSFAVLLGVSSAIYLSEVASPRVREMVKPSIEMIAGIPSVVLGLIGLFFLAPLVSGLFGLSSGLNGLTASVVVGVMVLPTVISVSEDVLSSLPSDFREASLALGATRFQTIRMTLLPAAMSGIVASIMLGLGRAVGETMAVLMVAGNSRAMPSSIFDPVRPMTANIAIEIKEVVRGSLHYQSLFAIGLVLFVMTFVLNLLSDIVIERQSRRYRW